MDLFSKIKVALLGVSLKWKLLIPFLFFAFSGTTLLAFIGLTSQHSMIKREEKKVVEHHYKHFLNRLEEKQKEAMILASLVAEYPLVQMLVGQRDRASIFSLLQTAYERMRAEYNISQFHFHVPPAESFLRLHRPGRFGDDTSESRQMVYDAISKGKSVSGVERGTSGLGIRGVVPLIFNEAIVGCIEIGHSFGKAFIDEFYKAWGAGVSLYEVDSSGRITLLASNGPLKGVPVAKSFLKNTELKEPLILISPDQFPELSLLIGPVKDYSGKVVAIAGLGIDRSDILQKLNYTRSLMVGVGLAGVIISFLLTYLVIMMFIRPLKEIVRDAKNIASKKRWIRLAERPGDEIGELTQALNTMLESLKGYARTLEIRVQERTADLVDSEEKYKALVENVPLIVYRVLRDGTTEFVNSHLTECLGYTIEEAVSDRRFWRDKISGVDSDTYKAINENCFLKGIECRLESRAKSKDGRYLTFITHALPGGKSVGGKVQWIDGIMLDITELKRLQERAIQSEEIRTLGEISARMAHEIRNPLLSAGGFARRLSENLEDGDPNKKMADIIMKEASKLESFLKILLSSIEPFDLEISEVDLNSLIKTQFEKLEDLLRSRRIELKTDFKPGLPEIQADKERLGHAFENILKHAIVSAPEEETVYISTAWEDDSDVVEITHEMEHLSEDDLEKFFFPHIELVPERTVLDLPLSKIVIHRHGGKIELSCSEENILLMRIGFPAISGNSN